MLFILHKLLEKIKNDCVITKELFQDYNLDDILYLRDDEIFDNNWVKLYNNIKGLEISKEYLEIINEIREEVFIKTYSISEYSEIAGDISDDFDLICRAYILKVNSYWLNSVIYLYANDIIPCDNIDISESNMGKVLNQLLNK